MKLFFVILAFAVVLPTTGFGAPPNLIHGANTKEYSILEGRGSAQMLFNADTGVSELSVTLLRIKPGGIVPTHVHQTSSEFLIVENGRVKMTVDSRTFVARKGDAIYIPAGVSHSAEVISTRATFRATQIYSPAGPEQRFKNVSSKKPASN